MKLETLRYHTLKTQDLYLTWAWIGIGSWRTDGQTDKITIACVRLALRAVACSNERLRWEGHNICIQCIDIDGKCVETTDTEWQCLHAGQLLLNNGMDVLSAVKENSMLRSYSDNLLR